jgi:biotin transport system substrate-specific component
MKQGILTARNLVMCAFFSALIAVGAFIRVPIPLGDYFTLQFMFVLLAGFLLGAKLGAVSAGVYLLTGLAGAPIFAAGGGFMYIFRPSFGYLLGFVLTAFLVGHLASKNRKGGFAGYFFIALVGMAATYLIGFTYKYIILNFYLGEGTSLWTVILASLTLDIPGDILLCALSSALALRLRKMIGTGGNRHVQAS